MTVLFSDIRGFTDFLRDPPARGGAGDPNRYHEEMTEAVMGHGGTLISFIGDGIMAVFGALIEQPDHADRGLAAALEMLSLRLPRFNDWMREARRRGRFLDRDRPQQRPGDGGKHRLPAAPRLPRSATPPTLPPDWKG